MMSRRYLTINEAESALKRGKEVEIFLGGFKYGSQDCIRWASFRLSENEYMGSIWEAVDEGAADYLDLYTFSPATGEWDEPVKIATGDCLDTVVESLNIESRKFVNFGVVQDEYAEYLLEQRPGS